MSRFCSIKSPSGLGVVRLTRVVPLLRWAGSKRASVKSLSEYIPTDCRRYIEPFCGSAALFFHTRPSAATLSDVNSRLINFYKQCTVHRSDIWVEAKNIKRDRESYYLARTRFNECGDDFESAYLFFYLNRTCFNGIYRTNKKGGFNVPYSGERMPEFLPVEAFLSACDLISSADFTCLDFKETIRGNLSADNFFFIDPPYASQTRRLFVEYNKDSFNRRDLGDLVDILVDIDSAGAHFVCTYDADDAPMFEGRGWSIATLAVRRNVGGFGASRKVANEIVVSNVGAVS